MTPADYSRIQWGLRNHRYTLAECDEWIATLESERADLLDIRAEIEATIPPRDRRWTSVEHSAARDAKGDLLLVQHGVGSADGVSNPRLARRVGQPGLLAIERMLQRVRDCREADAQRQQVIWPRRFRVKTGTTYYDGGRATPCEPGEIVELTERQARAFADLFEPVVE